MKKINLMFIGLLLSFIVKGQMIVEDAGLNAAATQQNATMMQQLSEAFAHGKTLKDSYKGIQEGIKIYSQVSGALKTAKRVAKIIKMQYDIIKKAGEVMQKISNFKIKVKDILSADRMLSYLLECGQGNMDIMSGLMKDDVFKANDGQRIMILASIEKEQKVQMNMVNHVDRIFSRKYRLLTFYASIEASSN